MKDMMSRVSPGATTFIRMDHTHALASFHRYRIDARPEKKQAVADTLCLALEIHARLEEEIFYPAMRAFATRAFPSTTTHWFACSEKTFP